MPPDGDSTKNTSGLRTRLFAKADLCWGMCRFLADTRGLFDCAAGLKEARSVDSWGAPGVGAQREAFGKNEIFLMSVKPALGMRFCAEQVRESRRDLVPTRDCWVLGSCGCRDGFVRRFKGIGSLQLYITLTERQSLFV